MPHDVLANRRAIKSVIAAYTQPVLITTNRSKSHNNRRFLHNQAMVRSTTHRRGATSKSGLPGVEIPLVNSRSQPNSCFIHDLNGSPPNPFLTIRRTWRAWSLICPRQLDHVEYFIDPFKSDHCRFGFSRVSRDDFDQQQQTQRVHEQESFSAIDPFVSVKATFFTTM